MALYYYATAHTTIPLHSVQWLGEAHKIATFHRFLFLETKGLIGGQLRFLELRKLEFSFFFLETD